MKVKLTPKSPDATLTVAVKPSALVELLKLGFSVEPVGDDAPTQLVVSKTKAQ